MFNQNIIWSPTFGNEGMDFDFINYFTSFLSSSFLTVDKYIMRCFDVRNCCYTNGNRCRERAVES